MNLVVASPGDADRTPLATERSESGALVQPLSVRIARGDGEDERVETFAALRVHDKCLDEFPANAVPCRLACDEHAVHVAAVSSLRAGIDVHAHDADEGVTLERPENDVVRRASVVRKPLRRFVDGIRFLVRARRERFGMLGQPARCRNA